MPNPIRVVERTIRFRVLDEFAPIVQHLLALEDCCGTWLQNVNIFVVLQNVIDGRELVFSKIDSTLY